MKRSLVVFLFAAAGLMGSAPLFAETPVMNGYGGYSGPGPQVATVKQALSMQDDAPVALRGRIVQRLGDEKYLFGDDTGTIRVEIDHDKWHGLHVSAEDIVEIQGEVDRDWNKTEVDVSRVIKVQ